MELGFLRGCFRLYMEDMAARASFPGLKKGTMDVDKLLGKTVSKQGGA